MICCFECARELEDADDDKPYPWTFVNGHIYCRSCADKP